VKGKYSGENSCGCRVSFAGEMLRNFFSQTYKGETEAEHVWCHVGRIIMGGLWDLRKNEIG